MNYPENIKTRKQRMIYWFFTHYYVLNMGKGQVLGRFTSILPELVAVIAFFELYLKIHLNVLAILMIIVCWFSISYMIGYYYMKTGCDKIDNQVNSQRNPLIDAIYKKVKGKARI